MGIEEHLDEKLAATIESCMQKCYQARREYHAPHISHIVGNAQVALTNYLDAARAFSIGNCGAAELACAKQEAQRVLPILGEYVRFVTENPKFSEIENNGRQDIPRDGSVSRLDDLKKYPEFSFSTKDAQDFLRLQSGSIYYAFKSVERFKAEQAAQAK